MAEITLSRLQAYRAETFHLHPGLRITTPEEAANYINQRGFIHFWPIKGVTLPSLWGAVAGDRPVANAHDDPGHITWGWKDANLGTRRWYYAKVLRKKATLISLDTAPYFYALSENYGEPEQDYLIQYQEGKLTQEARLIYESLLDFGPLDTIEIRRKTHLTSKDSNSRFERAMSLLQADFKILPVGVSDSGAWRYAFIYDLVHRHYPALPEQAHSIRQRQAREHLINLYFQSVGAAQVRDISKLFGWRKADIEKTLAKLIEGGKLIPNLVIKSKPGTWLALQQLT